MQNTEICMKSEKYSHIFYSFNKHIALCIKCYFKYFYNYNWLNFHKKETYRCVNEETEPQRLKNLPEIVELVSIKFSIWTLGV